MKHLVYYDDQTGNIEDATGYVIGFVGVSLPVPSPIKENKSSDIDALIKLKASGFTADDLIKMGGKL